MQFKLSFTVLSNTLGEKGKKIFRRYMPDYKFTILISNVINKHDGLFWIFSNKRNISIN